MTSVVSRPRPQRRRRRLRALWWPLAALVAFAAGIFVGEALRDNPTPGGTQTVVRTLKPLPVAPAAAKTVTVTVEATRP